MKIKAATLQAAMNQMKYRPGAGVPFFHPFGSNSYCEVHRGKSKTAVNGVCQACSSNWNAKKIQDFLHEQRIKQGLR